MKRFRLCHGEDLKPTHLSASGRSSDCYGASRLAFLIHKSAVLLIRGVGYSVSATLIETPSADARHLGPPLGPVPSAAVGNHLRLLGKSPAGRTRPRKQTSHPCNVVGCGVSTAEAT